MAGVEVAELSGIDPVPGITQKGLAEFSIGVLSLPLDRRLSFRIRQIGQVLVERQMGDRPAGQAGFLV